MLMFKYFLLKDFDVFIVSLYPALFVLEQKGRETYSADQDNEVSNTYKNKQ